MNYVVIDTNVIVSALREVLTRKKFGFNKEKIDIFLFELKLQSVFINPPKLKVVLPDAKDLCFYEAAMVYENVGGLLVTGNTKHFPGCSFAVTPAQLKISSTAVL